MPELGQSLPLVLTHFIEYFILKKKHYAMHFILTKVIDMWVLLTLLTVLLGVLKIFSTILFMIFKKKFNFKFTLNNLSNP